jgi:DNA-binding response OmpR family regulator
MVYLQKPYEPEELLAKIKKLLEDKSTDASGLFE